MDMSELIERTKQNIWQAISDYYGDMYDEEELK